MSRTPDIPPTEVLPAPASAEQPRDSIGCRAFGRYELLMEMGKGGMATLYLARLSGPQNFEKLLAIKKIHDHLSDDEEFVNMFLDEARLSARIHHPNVVSIYDMGRIEGAYFIAMEYVHGQNLADVIKAALRNRGIFGWEYACRVVADAAAGLHSAHELKAHDGSSLCVVHRDVSPHNILLSYDGHVKVVDFGIAFATERMSTTRAGTLKGRLGYLAPEITINAPIDRRVDIFSLGIVLYELCTLRRLFRGKSDADTIMRVREAKIPRLRDINSAIPAALEPILFKALSVDPDGRYATAEKFSEDLDDFLVNHKKSVSRSKMTDIMDRLFYDRRRIKDEQIKRAMDNPTPNPLVGVGMSVSSDQSLRTSLEVPSNPRRRLKLWYGVAGAVALVLSLATGLYFFTRSTPSEKDTANRSGMSQPMGVTIKLDIKPAVTGTVTRFRGQLYPGHNFQVVVAPSDKAERLLVQAPGYNDESVVVVPLADSMITVRLKRAPAASAPPMTSPMDSVDMRDERSMHVRSSNRKRRRRRRPRPMGGLRDFPD